MRFLGLEITRTKGAVPLPPLSPARSGGWWPLVRESFTGAWQQNVEITADTALSYWAVFACVTLIAADIAKLRLRLVEQDDDGIWNETTNPAFSPVLRKPNRYQTTIKFVEQWLVSKLLYGNTYVLKQRDNRGVVVALYVLNPTRVSVLVAPDGGVYYQLSQDDLTGLDAARLEASPIVPASEIIHDLMVPLFHPLVGVPPIYACGAAALQGLKIQSSSTKFFGNAARPNGIIYVPGDISQAQAETIKNTWTEKYTGDNFGAVALLTNGMKFEGMTMTAVDAQLLEQLKWTEEPICACYHVPVFMIDSTKTPAYGNSEPLTQQYYSQCLQSHTTSFEAVLDEGLGLGPQFGNAYGTEFDIDDLIWMDTKTKTTAANDSIGAGALAPNEARKKFFGLGKVKGGDSVYLQQQYFSLEALAERDASQPFATPPIPNATPAAPAADAAPAPPTEGA